MNLLIVDDEYLVVEEVVTVTDWGMLGITEIYSATNAVSAVRILNEKKIDIMICDIEMPQTDGLELSKKAKENFPDLEIVMLTSHAEFIYVRTALRYGCYDYLLKPVMEDDIIKVMKNLVLNSHPSFPFCKRVSHFESDLQILYPTFHFCNDFPVFFLAFMI